MACDEYLELISAAVDGALSPAEEERLTAHLVDCPECRELLSDLQVLHARLSQLPAVEVPEGLTERILAAVEKDNVTPLPVKKPGFRWKRWASTAAVLALVLVGGWRMGFGRSGVSGPEAAGAAPAALEDAAGASQATSEAVPYGDSSDVFEAADNGELEAPRSGEAPVQGLLEAAPTPAPISVPSAAEEVAPAEEAVDSDASGEEAQAPVGTMSMMRSALPPITAEGGEAPAAGGADAGLPGETPEGAEAPQVFLFTNSPADLDAQGSEAVGVMTAEVGELTAREALERLLEEYPMPEDAQLVDTEEFLGWQGVPQGLGGMVAQTTLEYLGLSPNGQYYEFCLYSNAVYAGPAESTREPWAYYAVGMEAGDLLSYDCRDFSSIPDEEAAENDLHREAYTEATGN